MPSRTIEKKYFNAAMPNVNIVYLGENVSISIDRDYSKEFWYLLGAYFSMRQPSACGLVFFFA
jgi:hypothetical protein